MTTSIQDRGPTHRLYLVKGEGKATSWIEIGAAWTNTDGKGFSLSLDAIPVTGRLVMREATPKAAKGGQS